ncbi:MAG TPA: GAF domain-containing protein [Pyrinomonadaceae bacterium]|nr:GAF domain-containing protein [Pyrinomonadaceae bacterium]
MSEELENSLQQAIESYLGDRLRAIDEQLSRLQAEFNEALSRLRESSATESLEATSVAESIAAHLQAAREQRLTEGAMPASEQSGEVAAVKRGVEAIEKQQSQTGVLGSLLTGAAQFAERVALFVIRNEQALGWRECEASDPTNLESIRGITLPLSAETLLGRAARSGSPWSGAPGSNSEDDLLIGQLGGEPQSVAAVPLVVRGKVVAVLYADAASTDPNAINLDALELLARVAGMAVDLISGPRSAPETQVSETESVTQPAVAETQVVPEAVEAEQAYEAEPGYEPEVEPQAPEVVAESEFDVVHEVEVAPAPEVEVSAEPVTEVVAESEVEVAHEVEVAPAPEVEVSAEPVTEVVAESEVEVAHEVEVSAEPVTEVVAEKVAEQEEAAAFEPALGPSTVEPEPAPPTFVPMAPGSAAQYSTPLGSFRRRSVVAEPDLPIEVGEEERRLHNDARRFARLLVSEIKLYNEKKVNEGRNQSDIYDRLRDDIDRSRQMYEKRVAPPVAARHDYFHQELVNTLAEGDSAKLGSGYPGASVAVS